MSLPVILPMIACGPGSGAPTVKPAYRPSQRFSPGLGRIPAETERIFPLT
jgi:hypothetical protein